MKHKALSRRVAIFREDPLIAFELKQKREAFNEFYKLTKVKRPSYGWYRQHEKTKKNKR